LAESAVPRDAKATPSSDPAARVLELCYGEDDDHHLCVVVLEQLIDV
jgi:hypothetical protein